jgi:hypothetical protein
MRSLLRGSVAEISPREHLNDIYSQINDHKPNEIYTRLIETIESTLMSMSLSQPIS